MRRDRIIWCGLATVTAMIAAPLVLAQGTHFDRKSLLQHSAEPIAGLGTFTPAAADPRLAAALAHSGIMSSGFRFTPSTSSFALGHNITVAVRARSVDVRAGGPVHAAQIASSDSSAASASLPIAYNLGAAVGWKKFALTSDYRKTDLGLIQGGRVGEGAGVTYTARKWSSRVSISTEHATSNTPKALGITTDVALDVGGAYRLSRNLDLTAGVRYKREHDRFYDVVDDKRDSQAVYIGTQFKF